MIMHSGQSSEIAKFEGIIKALEICIRNFNSFQTFLIINLWIFLKHNITHNFFCTCSCGFCNFDCIICWINLHHFTQAFSQMFNKFLTLHFTGGINIFHSCNIHRKIPSCGPSIHKIQVKVKIRYVHLVI